MIIYHQTKVFPKRGKVTIYFDEAYQALVQFREQVKIERGW